MPTRRRTAAALAVLSTGLLAILSGCGSTPERAAPPPPITTASTPAGPTSTAAPRPAPATATRPSSPAPRPTTRPTPRPTPEPAAGPTSTGYGQLTDVWHTGPSSYALSYDPVDLLTGKAAAAYYRAHPDQEPLDFAISNPDATLDQLPVAANGTFYGNQLLGTGNGSRTTRITGDQLIARLNAHPRTLVKVTQRPAGNHPEVVSVTEVYLP